MAAVSKNLYFNVLDDALDKCNDKYYKTIKVKPIYVKIVFFAEYSANSKANYPEFKIDDHVIISKYQNIFAKCFAVNGSKKCLWLEKLKILYHWHTLLVISTVKKLIKQSMKISCRRRVKRNLESRK